MSEKLTEEELMEVIGGAIRRDKAYWARGRSDSENARWSQNINKLEQAYNQLKEIIKTYFFAEVPKQKEGQIKPTVTREDIENLIIAWMELLRPDAMYDLVKKWLIAHDMQVANGK